MPILGIIASSVAKSSASFDSIATVTAAGGETVLSFTSIPQTYKHLQVRGLYRDTGGATARSIVALINFNNDTGSNYLYNYLYGNGTTVSVNAGTATTSTFVDYAGVTSPTAANTFGLLVYEILDYASTNKFKSGRAISGGNNKTTTTDYGLALSSTAYLSTNAINRIDIKTGQTSFAAGTTYSLYGIKG